MKSLNERETVPFGIAHGERGDGGRGRSEESKFAGPVVERNILHLFVQMMVMNSSRETPAPRW